MAGLNPNLIEEIYLSSQSNVALIQKYLKNWDLDMLSYSNLEWRIDINVSSRSLRKCVEPEIVLKLDLTKNNEKTTHILQTDVVNLVHLTNSLEEALNEIKNSYCRRVFRNI